MVIPARFRGQARRDAAAFYLTQLGKAMLDGELAVRNGEESTTLIASEFLLMRIEVTQKKRANHVDIKLRWPRPSRGLAAGG